MGRYFVDTSCLLGLVFLHDRWHRDINPIVEQGNQIYASNFVLYEFCSRESGEYSWYDDSSEFSVDIDKKSGKFGYIRNDLLRELPKFNRELDKVDQESLDIDSLIRIFMDHFEVRKQARPQITDWFEEYFESREFSHRTAKKSVSDLIDHILVNAEQRKEEILDEMKIVPSKYDSLDDEKRKLDAQIGITYQPDQSGIHIEDANVLLDAISLCKEGEASKFVTGDKKHFIRFQEEIKELFDVSVLYIKDDFETVELTNT